MCNTHCVLNFLSENQDFLQSNSFISFLKKTSSFFQLFLSILSNSLFYLCQNIIFQFPSQKKTNFLISLAKFNWIIKYFENVRSRHVFPLLNSPKEITIILFYTLKNRHVHQIVSSFSFLLLSKFHNLNSNVHLQLLAHRKSKSTFLFA